MTDSLVEINKRDLENLKSLYIPDDMKSDVTYTTIDTYIRLFKKDPNLENIKIFCLNGDFSDGTFVVIVNTQWKNVTEMENTLIINLKFQDCRLGYADTLIESNGRLSRLFQLIDFSKNYRFRGIRTAIATIIERALEKQNATVEYDTILLYYLSKEEALKFDVQ